MSQSLIPPGPASAAGSFDVLVEELAAELQAGGPIDIESYIQAHPEHAERLRQLLPTLEALARLGPSLAGSDSDAAAGGTSGPGPQTLGDFRIVREVGRGGMGVVYEAEQLSLGRRVALKVLPFAATLDPRQLQRFHNEAKAAACLHHTNIVPVHAVGCERGVHFYAMQLIDGESLAAVIADLRRLASRGRQPPEAITAYKPAPAPGADAPGSPAPETRPAAVASTLRSAQGAAYYRAVAQLGVQAAEALDHAHQAGILHRDIKPANLLVDAAGRLWVTDFGLARVQSESLLTVTGDLVGTLRYMSPEQALAKRVVVDHRTDVYSLGATLYELLTLEPAFTGKDREELLRQIAFEEPKPLRRVNKAIPAELEVIVLKALEKNPADRYATAQELADDLRRYLLDEPIRARRPSPVQRLRKMARRHRAAVTAAAVCLLVVLMAVAGSVGWFIRDRESRRVETNRVVSQALNESQEWQTRRRLPEALSAAQRAVGLVVHREAEETLLRRVEARVADLELLSDLEDARLEATAMATGKFDFGLGDRLSDAACRRWGLDVAAVSLEEAAERVLDSSVVTELAAALEFWSRMRQESREPSDSSWVHLLRIARAADPDPVRDRLREALERQDGGEFAALAAPAASSQLPPSSLTLLASALHKGGAPEQAMALLQRARRQYPDDFWLNHSLAYYFLKAQPPRPEGAVRYFTAALALRPNSPGVHLNLAVALKEKGDMDGAIAECRAAITLKQDFAEAHSNLGAGLLDKGDVDGAIAEVREALQIKDFAPARYNLGNALAAEGNLDGAAAEYREAIRLQKDYPEAHNNLGNVAWEKGRLDEAIACFQEVTRLQKDHPGAHNNLGGVLKAKGRLEEAIAEFREALRLKPDVAETQCNLGLALVEKGEYREAVALLRRGHELGSRNPRWPHPSAQWLREAERLAGLEVRLPALLQGQERPKDAGELLDLARFCQQRKKYFAASARWYGEAFAAQAALADDLQIQDRYNAACAAALGGCGQGQDADKLSPEERAAIRRQALGWLRDDLKAYRQLPDKAGLEIAQRMQHWLQDTDFAGVRGAEALAKLPEAERGEWQKLWQEVEALRQRAARLPGRAPPKAPE